MDGNSRRIDTYSEENIPLTDLRDKNMSEPHVGTSSLSYDDTNLETTTSLDTSYANYYNEEKTPKWKRFFISLWKGPRSPSDIPAKRIGFLIVLEELVDGINSKIPFNFRLILLISYFTFWFGFCYNILIPYHTIPPHSTLYQNASVLTLSCSGDSRFWKGKNDACGENGSLCEPNLTEDIIFRCPALCDRGSWTYSFIPIGDQHIKYRGYFVGGGDEIKTEIDENQLSNPYRSDSFPCGAAVHAGIISAVFGGCARISYTSGSQSYFAGVAGHYGVSDSISFNSFFPSSFFFKELLSSPDEQFKQCLDPGLIILITNILLGIPVVLFCSGTVSYWSMSIVGFWTITLATDPPFLVDPSDPELFPKLLSLCFERFLPSCFILYVLWHCSVKRTFTVPEDSGYKISYVSRLILWYPLFWLGILNNVTFDRLPVDRLTLADLKNLPGAFIAVSSIITVIAVCAVIQAYKIWLSGRFKKYLGIYLSFIVSLVILGNLPGLTLRIHHYILAMLLIPGCATRGRTALMFQGILLGLFLSGASRWGFASIVETASALRRDDPTGTILPPEILGFNSSGFLSWNSIPQDISSTLKNVYKQYDGITLLINDIERYSGKDFQSIDLNELLQQSDMADMISNALTSNNNGDISIYLRIARKILSSKKTSDFSQAAILKWPSGQLTLPKPGVT